MGVRLRKEKEERDLVGPPELARCASFNYLALTCYVHMGIEALCAAPPEAPSLQVGPVAAVGVGHLRIVHHLLVCERNTAREALEVLASRAPATAMVPLPVALSAHRSAPSFDSSCGLGNSSGIVAHHENRSAPAAMSQRSSRRSFSACRGD